MMDAKKEEATKAAADKDALTDKMNVMDINVEEDFEIDDI